MLHVKDTWLEQTLSLETTKTACLHNVSHHRYATKWSFTASCSVFFKFPFDDGKCFLGDIITSVKDFFVVYKADIVLIR
jgi:hypothetical protein